MCFEPLKIIVTCLLATFVKAFQPSLLFFFKRVLHWTKHWQLNLLLKNLSRKSVRVSGAELENNFNHNTSGFWNKVWSMSNFTYMPDWLLIAQCGGPGTLLEQSWAGLPPSSKIINLWFWCDQTFGETFGLQKNLQQNRHSKLCLEERRVQVELFWQLIWFLNMTHIF